jgi:hypothetical protein
LIDFCVSAANRHSTRLSQIALVSANARETADAQTHRLTCAVLWVLLQLLAAYLAIERRYFAPSYQSFVPSGRSAQTTSTECRSIMTCMPGTTFTVRN